MVHQMSFCEESTLPDNNGTTSVVDETWPPDSQELDVSTFTSAGKFLKISRQIVEFLLARVMVEEQP